MNKVLCNPVEGKEFNTREPSFIDWWMTTLCLFSLDAEYDKLRADVLADGSHGPRGPRFPPGGPRATQPGARYDTEHFIFYCNLWTILIPYCRLYGIKDAKIWRLLSHFRMDHPGQAWPQAPGPQLSPRTPSPFGGPSPSGMYPPSHSPAMTSPIPPMPTKPPVPTVSKYQNVYKHAEKAQCLLCQGPVPLLGTHWLWVPVHVLSNYLHVLSNMYMFYLHILQWVLVCIK